MLFRCKFNLIQYIDSFPSFVLLGTYSFLFGLYNMLVSLTVTVMTVINDAV